MIPAVYHKWILPFLIVVHIAGIFGLAVFPTWFALLTPLNLIVCAVLVILGTERPNTKFVVSLLFIAFLGWIVEVVGVKTEWIFGRYSYGAGLGIKLLDVPLVIGLNWAVLSYSVVQVSMVLFSKASRVVMASIAASLMVLLDLAMEWPAPLLDFWSFGTKYAPIHNFIGWWCVAFFLVYMFLPQLASRQNKLAVWYYQIQLVFFLAYGLVDIFFLR